MSNHDLDSLLLLTHQQHEQRLREADTERLARRLRRTPQTRRRLPARTNPNLTPATATSQTDQSSRPLPASQR